MITEKDLTDERVCIVLGCSNGRPDFVSIWCGPGTDDRNIRTFGPGPGDVDGRWSDGLRCEMFEELVKAAAIDGQHIIAKVKHVKMLCGFGDSEFSTACITLPSDYFDVTSEA